MSVPFDVLLKRLDNFDILEIDEARSLIVVGENETPLFQIEWDKDHPEEGPTLIRSMKTGETTKKED